MNTGWLAPQWSRTEIPGNPIDEALWALEAAIDLRPEEVRKGLARAIGLMIIEVCAGDVIDAKGLLLHTNKIVWPFERAMRARRRRFLRRRH